MNNSFLNKSHEAATNLLEERNGLNFVKFFVWFSLEIVFEISIAQLLNNIVIMTTHEDIEESNYVGRW